MKLTLLYDGDKEENFELSEDVKEYIGKGEGQIKIYIGDPTLLPLGLGEFDEVKHS